MQTNSQTTGSKSRNRHATVLARWFVCLLSPVSCLLTLGCAPNKRYDLIEAELRTRERELAETRTALEQSRNLNRAYVEQSRTSNGPVVPNPSAPTFVPVKEIALGRGTGGVDEDNIPGDEALMVVVVPKDEDGAAVKVPAELLIAAWEITPAGEKNSIGNWSIPAEKVRPTWRSGFISTGYFVAVPWQAFPSVEHVRVAVRLITLDGRSFETDKDILVKLCSPRPAGSAIPTPKREPLFPDALPPSGTNLPPPLPPGVEELPLPSPVERGAKLLPPVKE
jgi:hypothetical protein